MTTNDSPFDQLEQAVRKAGALQAELNAAGLGDPSFAAVQRLAAEAEVLKRENQGLHAENGRLLETNGDLRADNERLRECWDTEMAAHKDTHDTLRAELEQLRISEQRRTEELQTAMAKVVQMRTALEWVRDETELWDAPIVLEALR